MATIRLFAVVTVLVTLAVVKADPVGGVKHSQVELQMKLRQKPQPKASVTTSQDCKCGRQSSSRIVGGTSAASGEVPWQVSVLWRYGPKTVGYPFCGGTIISAYHVITAAQCTKITTSGNYAIMYGSLNREPDFTKIIDVEVFTEHPSYSARSMQNDISIFKLQTALMFSSSVGPACLPDVAKDYAGETSLLSGWGHTTFGGSYSDILLKVELPVGADSTCSAMWGYIYNSETMLCTEGSTTKDSCQGDTGGPMVVKNSGSYDLAGVISFAYNCAYDVPALYTRVTSYLDWIHETVSLIPDDYFCSK